MTARNSIVRIENLTHRFGVGALEKTVLRNVTAEFFEGEIAIIMGPSGSGKTTFLSLMGALRSVQSGSIQFRGRNLANFDQDGLGAVRREIGFIFQAHNLVGSISACENVQLPLHLTPGETAVSSRERALELLTLVGMKEHAHKTPRQLSGGQCQRVAIARALVRRPRLVLADEPTASLDRETGRAVLEALQTLARQYRAAILIVTHDHRILDIADRVILIEDGGLEELEQRLEKILIEIANFFTILSQRLQGREDAPGISFEESTTLQEQRVNSLSHLKTKPVPAQQIDLLQQMLGSARLLGDSTGQFARLACNPQPGLEKLSDRFLQALDIILLTAESAFKERDPADIQTLLAMTGDRKETMARLRQSYFETIPGLNEEQRVFLFDLTNTFGRAVYLLNTLALQLERWPSCR